MSEICVKPGEICIFRCSKICVGKKKDYTKCSEEVKRAQLRAEIKAMSEARDRKDQEAEGGDITVHTTNAWGLTQEQMHRLMNPR